MSKNVAQLTEELEQSKTREHLLGKELRSLQVILLCCYEKKGIHAANNLYSLQLML